MKTFSTSTPLLLLAVLAWMPQPRAGEIAASGSLPVAGATRQRTATEAVAAGDVVLLDFSAAWCGPCRQMAPLIGELGAAGWLVRHVDVDQEADLVKRFGVTAVPCYVLLVRGHEVGRINGATNRNELERLLARSRQPLGLPVADQPPAAAPAIAGVPMPRSTPPGPLPMESPPAARVVPPAVIAGGPSPAPAAAAPSARQTASDARPDAAVGSRQTLDRDSATALQERLLRATARLRVEDQQGASWGTGTVVDCRQGEALILTCGHIFRDSQGRGRIEVDLFGVPGARGIAGQIVAYDLTRDLALVSVFTDQPLEPAVVGGVGREVVPGETVVTIGCDGGRDPTMLVSQITAVDKYLGPANVQVAGQPVQGRSGGGLFDARGTLLGVCNAADPEDNEGLFAALPTIHEQLDEAGLAFVYRHVYPNTDVAAAPDRPTVPHLPDEMPAFSFDRRDRSDALPTASTGPQPTTEPAAAVIPESSVADSGGLTPGEQALIDHVRRHEGKAEVICIVRSRGEDSQSEVFVLENASPAFVERLSPAPGQPGTR